MATPSSSSVAPTGDNRFLLAVGLLSSVSGWIAAALILAAVTITCQMIFVRFVLNESTIWQTEAVVYLVIAATLLGLSYVQRHRGHVNVDLLPLMLSMRVRTKLAFFTFGLGLVIVGFIFTYSLEFWYEAWSRNWKSDTVWGVRLWIPYLAMPVGFGLYLLQLLADFIALVLKIDTPFGLGGNE